MKLIWAAAVFFGGWLWSYLFVRQFLFNLLTALPLIKRLRALREDLIAVGADRYTTISFIACALISAILIFIVLRFCPLYLILCFFAGAASVLLMLLGKLTPGNRAMFDAFCASYCRFVPDDELRAAMFGRKPPQIKARLKAMGFSEGFVPEFKN